MAIQIRMFDPAIDLVAVRDLFRSYAASLPVDLSYQDFDTEVAQLPGSYAPPRGCLLVAADRSGKLMGCVGVRPLAQDGVCEMKRLYLKPEARGLGLGRAMVEAAIGEAKHLGYQEMLLDSLPSMGKAIALYRQLGFRAVAPYYHPVPDGTIFLALDL